MKKIILSFFAIYSFSIFAQALDPTFDSDGIKTHNLFLNNNNEDASAIVIQGDGKYVVAGYYHDDDTEHPLIVRFNTDGTLDNTFSADGKVDAILTSDYSRVSDIVLDGNGKIVVTGYAQIENHQVLFVARYNSDGSLDENFDSDGIFTYENVNLLFSGFGLAVQSDGKILVAGSEGTGSLGVSDFLILRLNSNGTLDNGFNSSGVQAIDIGNYDVAYAVALQSDNKIIIAGLSSAFENLEIASTTQVLVRLGTDGALDNTFDTDGIVEKSVSTLTYGTKTLVLANDKILLSGTHGDDFEIMNSFLLKFNADGSPDNTFGVGGLVEHEFSEFGDEIYSIAITTDNKIFAVGSAYTELEGEELLAIRFNADGSIEEGSGALTTNLDNGSEWLANVAIQADGKFVAVGAARWVSEEIESSDSEILLVRYDDIINGILEARNTNISLMASPNPVQDYCVIAYSLQASDDVRISLLNAQGSTVQTLAARESKSAGEHKQLVEMTELAPGMYTVLFEGNELNTTIKLIKK